jgi:hypothetical protein
MTIYSRTETENFSCTEYIIEMSIVEKLNNGSIWRKLEVLLEASLV